MVVNPAYKGIQLPVDQWPLLSTFEPKAYYQTDNNDCLYNDPVPFLPLVAAPLASLEDISESMQFDVANSTTDCSQPDVPTHGRREAGHGRPAEPGEPLHDRDHPAGRRPALPAAARRRCRRPAGTSWRRATASLQAAAALSEAGPDLGDLARPVRRVQPAERSVGVPGHDGRLRRRPDEGPADQPTPRSTRTSSSSPPPTARRRARASASCRPATSR